MQKKLLHEILNIYKTLLLNANQLDANDINRLYIEYLKLSIRFGTNNPTYEKDLYAYNRTNCYCYALGLKFPWIFYKLYLQRANEDFAHNIGFISYKNYSEDKKSILENLYSDLDVLKIQTYDADIESHPSHGGYKIAVYVAEDYDFHILRQNKDGIWSHKLGYTDYILKLPQPEPLNPEYELVKTLEIVKPTFK